MYSTILEGRVSGAIWDRGQGLDGFDPSKRDRPLHRTSISGHIKNAPEKG